MAGTMDKPFLESVAGCSVCLDLKKEYLRRQWRQFGRLPALDAPYSVTLKKISESVESTACGGCSLILKAASEIKKECNLDFRNAILEYVDQDGQEGLSLTLTMLHPLHTKPDDWERAQASPDIKTTVHTGPRTKTSKRQWEYRVASPRYEIFKPEASHQLEDPAEILPKAPSADLNQTSNPNSWDSILSRPFRCGNTGSDEAINWTRLHIDRCANSHKKCNLEGSRAVLPTRVLDLGDNTQEGFTSDIKLYVTQREEEPYLCLSHCWGADRESMPLGTTLGNFAEFQRCIPWECLSRTFQDAVAFTRKLGYRYLWIDSLCIVQNDIEDWMKEAGEMASVYENAVLTLAAASSSNSNGGLFRSSTIGVQLSEGPGALEILLRRYSDPGFFQYRSSDKFSDVNDVSPLLRRAWVFQERMLSRRVLFFTPLELVFECRNSSHTESGYTWVDSTAKLAYAVVFDKGNPHSAKLPDLWRSLVNDFTGLQLTMHKDTLPAMAGLAKRFKQIRNLDDTSYLAGLWKETFIQDMLWETKREMQPRFVVNTGMPTWSWARTGHPKKYEIIRNMVPLSNLEEAVCTSNGQLENLFTGVDSGYVILSGYLLPARLTSTGVIISQNPRVSHIPLNDYEWDKEGPQEVKDGDDLFVLPLAASASGKSDANIHSLVLRRCNEDKDVFTRIGIFQPSIYHLKHHEYIFEGRDTLLSLYQEDVKYGTSLLGKDGLYRESEDREGKPIYLTSNTDKAYRKFASRAWFLHLCLHGRHTESEHREFFGQPHLDALKTAMATEKERVREWVRRDEGGEDQKHKRVMIKII